MTIITLEELLEEIKAEPLNNGLSNKERRFINEIEYLKKDDIELYVKYWTKYLQIRNDKIRQGL